ncbi:MAG: TonB-dependent receptor [Bacteroidales bacterium]|nr:TonB-dependent receptor [Bacteroidales bacterium]
MSKITFSILLLLIGNLVIAQSVTGVILNENREPLAGANIVDRSQNAYTISHTDGSFKLNIDTTISSTLQLSYLGFKLKDLPYSTLHNKDVNLGEIQMEPALFETEEVSVVANRIPQLVMSIPADISVVSQQQIQLIASDKIDQNLKFTSGVFVDRAFGIFGKSVVGLRSVVSREAGRQLTLVDGVPINSADNGGTNWNRLIESDFQRIEVLKGPGATIYGNNAMGGAVNLVLKRPTSNKVDVTARTSYSTYNTLQADFSIMQKLSDKESSFYYTLAAKGLNSDGYITAPDTIRDKTDTAVFLKEYGANARLGYMFDAKSHIELEYNYYDEYRGQGTKILLEDGAVSTYKTHFTKLNYTNVLGKLKMDFNLFYQIEHYGRDIEKMKKGNYTHIKVNSDRTDYGALAMFHYELENHNFSFGGDFRSGEVYGVDEYQTSTDKVINQGKLDVLNLSIGDEWQISPKLKAIIGLNYAYGHFHNGAFLLEESTNATDFMKANSGPLDTKIWSGLSPRLALQYDFSKNMNIYSIYSQGFRAPSLDDITRFGFINIGYKEANPNLTPETLDNIEAGFRVHRKKWALQTNMYFSQGNNFMNYVATGDSLFGGRKLVYKKENVTTVYLYGAEINFDYAFTKSLRLNTNYTFNGSEIGQFDARQDLEGKKLAYIPQDMANISISYLHKKIKTSLNIHYQGKMYLDEVNTFEVNPLFSLDASITYEFYKKFSIRLSGQNLFDEQHMVSSDQISLGRYLSVGLQYGL